MQCAQCGLSNPPGTGVCTRCSTPLPLDDRTIEDSPRDSDTSCDADQTLTHGWSEPSAPIHRSVSAERFKPGRMLGNRYQILQLLGEGGMGAVYKARDRELDRLVALKIIRPNLAASSEILHRFKQELILARQITHRNVIRIFDLGEADGVKFITMEFIDGETLRTILLREGKLAPVEASKIIRQVCRGLEAAHAEGVVHRDLKPQNIMRDAQHRIVVMDFGVAHLADAAEIRPPRPPSGDASTRQAQPFYSQAGVLVGTPAYMAPEQALGQETDARSDIFALGIIFFELLTGKLPFPLDTPDALLKRTREKAKPVHDIDPKVPRSLSKIVERCLEPLRDFRYQTATEVLTHLDAWLAPAWRKAAKWVAAAAAVLLLVGTQIVVQRTHKTPTQHPPVSVLVADFKNDTADPIFDGTLEPMLGVALEGASFISLYNRVQARKVAAQLQTGTSLLDDRLARLVAMREGVSVVVSGSVTREGNMYRVSVKALDAVTGKTIANNTAKAEKRAILPQMGTLAAGIRKALGDKTPESAQLIAAETFSAASVEAAHEYALGEQAEWAGKKEEAITAYTRAVDLDPNLARAYANMAAISANLGRRDDAEKYHQMAMAKIDRMSDREKYKTRGIYYLLMRNDQKALEELNALLEQYPADGAGLQNLSVAYFYHRDWPRALEIGRRASEIYPKNVSRRNNVALYAMYAGDFETAEREARGALELNPGFAKAYLAMAMSQLARGQAEKAAETYRKLQTISPAGASLAATGLADLALYQGQTEEATAILQRGLADDVGSKNSTAAAIKSAMLASVHLGRGAKTPMLKAAEQATRLSKDDAVVVSVARVYAQAGLDAKAAALVSGLGARFEADPQAYAKLIQGEIQLSKGNLREAIKVFREAQGLADTWLGHFDLARAYVEASAFTEASSELDLCLKRRGEATALFLDDVPSYRYFPPVFYLLGRVQEGLKSPAATESYRAFLAIKVKSSHDPQVDDARRRLAKR